MYCCDWKNDWQTCGSLIEIMQSKVISSSEVDELAERIFYSRTFSAITANDFQTKRSASHLNSWVTEGKHKNFIHVSFDLTANSPPNHLSIKCWMIRFFRVYCFCLCFNKWYWFRNKAKNVLPHQQYTNTKQTSTMENFPDKISKIFLRFSPEIDLLSSRALLFKTLFELWFIFYFFSFWKFPPNLKKFTR